MAIIPGSSKSQARRAIWRTAFLLAVFVASSFGAFAQGITCNASASAPTVHAEGLTEKIGDVVLTCSGGQSAGTASLSIFLTLNTNISNRLDGDGNLTGITVSGGTTGMLQLYSATSIFINTLNYTIPVVPSTPVTITISGVRAAASMLPAGLPFINASIIGIGASFTSSPQIPVAFATSTLLSSIINNGIPCAGSPLPSTLDFAGFTSPSSVFSTIRITEANATSFSKKAAGEDTGLRILVPLSGYSAGSRVFVPDAIAGITATSPTTSGAFNTSPNPGSYTPALNQLLLIRVNGADSKGIGGTLVMPVPVAAQSFSTVSEISLTAGAGYVVYEVVDSNPNVREYAYIPVFLAAPQTGCNGTTVVPALSVALAPLSTVAVASATEPVPRFAQITLATDCTQQGDCSAAYFSSLMVDTTPLNFSAASLGTRQTASLVVTNAGGGVLPFTVGVTYTAPGSNWLTVTPGSAQNYANLQIAADPSLLQPGTYNASIDITAGATCVASATTYCKASVPVTFVVGPPGVTIQNVGNAASFQYGTVAPGSYAVIFGLNLAGTNVGVTVNQTPATVIFSNSTQINLIVPATLGNRLAADVVATVDGRVSNSFKVDLALNALGIFTPGIINFDDGTVNGASHPVKRGSFISVYLTGLSNPPSGQVTVNIGGQLNLIPAFAGAQPTLPALGQVNITVPSTLPATPNPVPLQVCIPGPTGQPACSNSVDLYVQ